MESSDRVGRDIESTNHPPTPQKNSLALDRGPSSQDAIVAHTGLIMFNHRNFPAKKYKKKCNFVILVVTTQHLGCGENRPCWWINPSKSSTCFVFWSMKGFKVDNEFDIPRNFNKDRYPKWWCLKSIPPQVWPVWLYIYIPADTHL